MQAIISNISVQARRVVLKISMVSSQAIWAFLNTFNNQRIAQLTVKTVSPNSTIRRCSTLKVTTTQMHHSGWRIDVPDLRSCRTLLTRATPFSANRRISWTHPTNAIEEVFHRLALNFYSLTRMNRFWTNRPLSEQTRRKPQTAISRGDLTQQLQRETNLTLLSLRKGVAQLETLLCLHRQNSFHLSLS